MIPFSAAPTKENKGRSLWLLLARAKLGLPIVVLSCSVFFLVGFFGSTLLSQDASDEVLPRERLMEVNGEVESEWPAMPYGDTGDPRPLLIPFQVLSWKPRALYFPQFATAEQCQTVVKIAKSRLAPSTLALRKGESEQTTKGIRTSSGTFLGAADDPSGALGQIEEKIARATMIPSENGEVSKLDLEKAYDRLEWDFLFQAFNVLRYEIGQRYASHYDAFNPAEYGPQKSQRVASFLLYLSDVEDGGETMFPFENGANMDIGYDYEKCIGLKVKPRKGDGLLFYSLFLNGTIDPLSLHGSCPVIKGEKWVATKWLRDKSRDVM